MSDVEHDLRQALQERIDPDRRPTPLPPRSRRSIRRRRAALVLSAATVVVAGAVAASALGDRTVGVVMDRDMRVIAPGPATGTNQDRVWDGDVAFEVLRLQCGHGPIGDQDSDLDPDGSFCTIGLTVINGSDRDVVVPQSPHVFTVGGRRFPPWERAMTELAADDPGSALTTPVPPGGAATMSLIFEYPSSLEPERLELHAAEGSSGAVIELENCDFIRYEGVVSGGCDSADAAVVEGVRYPHRVSGPRGGMALYHVCFDERQWEVVEPHPTAVSREGFAGQGYMTLESDRRAIFEDNSGVVLRLAPTEENDRDPSLCG